MNNGDGDNSDKFFDHAWKYFELSAAQRTNLFRFYIIFISIFGAGISFFLLKFQYPSPLQEFIVIVLSGIFAGITRVFKLLDKRNRQLIHYARSAMIHLEKNYKQNGEKKVNEEILIFSKEAKEKIEGRAEKGHTECFNRIFNIGYGVAVLVLSLSLYSICCPLNIGSDSNTSVKKCVFIKC